MDEQPRFPFGDSREEPRRPRGMAAQPFVLPHGPAHQVVVDELESLDQLGPVVAAVIADPAPHSRVDLLREVSEVPPAPQVKPPAFDLATQILRGAVGDRREEADELHASLAPRQPRTKRVAEERELLVLVRALAVRVLAVHDARLVQIELQTDLRQPLDNRVAHYVRLRLALAVQDSIVRIALERDVRELSDEPHVERVVQE